MKRKMTFGYVYDFRNPPAWRRPWTSLYAETIDFIAHTESIGFQSAWFAEHHVSGDGYLPSPLVAMAATAARTGTIKLGSSIALAPFYHPVRFAEECAIIDTISNGRLEMAVALGYRRREAEAYGVEFRTRPGRTNEFLEIVGRLWRGERFSFEGKHFKLKDAFIAPPTVRGHIPLYVGGFSEPALERAAKYADGYFGNEEMSGLYRAKLREHGKDPAAARILVQDIFFMVAQDPEKAIEEVAPHFHYVNNVYGEWLHEDQYDDRLEVQAFPQEMSLEEFKSRGMLNVMTPADAIAKLEALDPQVDHLMMMIPPGMPFDRFAIHAETFAREVIPHFDGS